MEPVPTFSLNTVCGGTGSNEALGKEDELILLGLGVFSYQKIDKAAAVRARRWPSLSPSLSPGLATVPSALLQRVLVVLFSAPKDTSRRQNDGCLL